jgi:hypothetical protein
VRLREVSVSWTVPSRFTRRIGFGAGDVTIAARNLRLWTNYEGADPEVQRNPNEQSILIDNWTVPPTRRYVVRFNLQF